MKKLMVALAAVATAFGLFADHPGFKSGQDFNDMQTGAFDGTQELGYWTMPDSGNESSIATVEWAPAKSLMIPEEYVEGTAGNSLAVKTTLGNPIFRKSDTAGAISEDSYVDFMATFTVFDAEDNPTLAGTDNKIALYLQETADGKGTNVMLRAGYFGASGIEPKDYNCGDVSELENFDEWNRVTVKSIVNIGGDKQGFVVFINGEPLVAQNYAIGTTPTLSANAKWWFDAGELFPSLNEGLGSVTGVAFDGQGGIDDVVFSTFAGTTEGGANYRLFAKDPESFTITWGSDMATLLTNNAPVVGNSPLTVYGTAPDSMTISWIGAAGKAAGLPQPVTKGQDGNYDLSGITVADAVASFGGVGYTLADAVTVANDAATAGKITLLDNAEGPVEIGKSGTTLDLAGFALTGAVSSKDNANIVFANSSATASTITGDCTSALGGFENNEFCNIKFDCDNNSNPATGDCGLSLTLPTGYKWGTDSTWWYLEALPKTWDATVVAAGEGVEITNLKTNGVDVTPAVAGKYTVGDEETVVVTYAIKTGWKQTDEIELSQTLEKDGTTSSTSPTATAKAYKLNATAGANTTLDKNPSKDTYTYGDEVVLTAAFVDGDFEWDQIPTGWNPGENDTLTLTYTILDEDEELGNVVETPTAKAKAAPIPPVIDQGSPEQKAAYGDWASKQAGTSFNPADPANVDRFILDMPATATPEELEEKLASIITADMLNQILAKGFDKVDFSALADTYPNAHFEFVVAPEIKAEEGVSGFYRLTAKFVPAN